MNSKERVFAAIGHKAVDRVPWGEIVIEEDVIKAYLGKDKVSIEEMQEFALSLGLDIICIQPHSPSPSEKGKLPSVRQFFWKDMDIWRDKTGLFIFAVLDGAFGWGVRVFGFQKFMMLISRCSSEVSDFARGVVNINRELASTAYDLGASGVLLADDIAYGKGLMINPDMFRKTLLPSIAEQVDTISGLGIPVFFHSDGNLMEIMDDIVSTGITGLHCLEPKSGMDLNIIKEKYKKRLCLWGNLDPDYLTSQKTPDEIEQAVKTIVNIAPDGKGLIFGTCTGLFKGVKPDNLKTISSLVNSFTARSHKPGDHITS